MITLRKISEEALAKASVLTQEQMIKVVGSGNQQCFLRCDQGSEEGVSVSDCERNTASFHCGDSLSKAVCTCAGN